MFHSNTRSLFWHCIVKHVVIFVYPLFCFSPNSRFVQNIVMFYNPIGLVKNSMNVITPLACTFSHIHRVNHFMIFLWYPIYKSQAYMIRFSLKLYFKPLLLIRSSSIRSFTGLCVVDMRYHLVYLYTIIICVILFLIVKLFIHVNLCCKYKHT